MSPVLHQQNPVPCRTRSGEARVIAPAVACVLARVVAEVDCACIRIDARQPYRSGVVEAEAVVGVCAAVVGLQQVVGAGTLETGSSHFPSFAHALSFVPKLIGSCVIVAPVVSSVGVHPEISMAVIRMAVRVRAGFSMSRVSVPGSCHLAPSGVSARWALPVLLARVVTGFGDDDVVELFDAGWVLLRTNLHANRAWLLLRLPRVRCVPRRVVAVPLAAGALSVRPGRLRRMNPRARGSLDPAIAGLAPASAPARVVDGDRVRLFAAGPGSSHACWSRSSARSLSPRWCYCSAGLES